MSKLNNIDDAIRDSFENFEVPFDASLWNNLESKLDNAPSNDITSFDKKIKESVSNHEVAYNPSAWTAVESQLVSTGTSYTKWFLAAGLIGLVSLGIYFITNTETEKTNSSENSSNEKLVDNKVKTELETENKNENLNNLNSSNESNSNLVENEIDLNTQSEEITNTEIEKIQNQTNNSLNTTTNQNNPIVSNENNNLNIVEKKWAISNPSITGKTEMCEGGEVKLISSSINEKVNIQWLLNGIYISDQKEITLKNLNAGTHEIELVHSAKEEFKTTCEKSILKKSIQLNVKENSSVDFKFEQVGDAFYPETKFQVLSNEKDTKYTWVMDNKSFEGEEFIYLFNNKGNYPVQLLAENENGCTQKEIKNIEISTDYNLLAPNSFSPNFDGTNDAFIPEALKYLNLPFNMNIVNRQGIMVFQTNRSDYPWDGRNINNGELCGQGVYLWVVELTNKEGKVEQYSGSITLLK
jgi:gliding motility-associated-like protein